MLHTDAPPAPPSSKLDAGASQDMTRAQNARIGETQPHGKILQRQ
jgi:hypothetical protein